MAIWRYLVLAGGLLAVAGFFAPLLEYVAPDGTLTGASAYEIATGTIDVSGLLSQAERLGLVTQAEAERATRILKQGIYAYRGAIVACFVPGALLGLVGLGAFARRRLGRLSGLLSIVLGLAAVGVWIFFYRAPDPSDQTAARLGLGLYCLAVGGLFGALGGLGALLGLEPR
jgi:4-amino-4-deoxy-L-arabinose transferase-like glycosyltransferase